MKLALLSCKNWPGALEAERAFAKEFPEAFDVHVEVWNDPKVDWAAYDYLIFRTVWDYFNFPDDFAIWLDHIDNLQIKTLNPIPIVKRNQHKFYLRDLEQQGIDIIPTVFISKNTGLDFSFLTEKNWSKAIIKPAISGGSYATTLFAIDEAGRIAEDYAAMALERDLLVQPFMPEIQTMGEVSILFFNGQFSHAIIKKPMDNDFRVQSQFGGLYQPCQPDDAVLETAADIVRTFGGELLYARVDGVLRDGQFLLMELELIEPDLYFGYTPNGKQHFFRALEEMVK